ncbi:MAG: hypothetical protein OSB41_02850 [Kiritimatiellae bacterium]|nr:hypothetical protein [Kiritimatiellia bacterium]
MALVENLWGKHLRKVVRAFVCFFFCLLLQTLQHGSGALNGLVNMIMKTGASHPGAFMRSEVGVAEDLWLVEGGRGFSFGPQRNLFIYAGLSWVGAIGA